MIKLELQEYEATAIEAALRNYADLHRKEEPVYDLCHSIADKIETERIKE